MFVDTSGWASYVDQRQLFHAKSAQLLQNVWRQTRIVVTTNYVLAELTALLNSPLRVPRVQQIHYLNAIRSSRLVEVVLVDSVLDGRAWTLWQARPDKNWTLADCASFVAMRQRSLTEALTTDHHFEQAGFVRLLK